MLTLACAACVARAPSPPTTVAAGPAARAFGVAAYEVVHADAHDLEVGLRGERAARLRVHAQADATWQHVESGATRFTLRTSEAHIAVDDAGGTRVLAERVGPAWQARATVDAAVRDWLAPLLAVDIDLAVQGTSIIHGGGAYVACTLECERASTCLGGAGVAACAAPLVTCAACLDQEPAP